MACENEMNTGPNEQTGVYEMVNLAVYIFIFYSIRKPSAIFNNLYFI